MASASRSRPPPFIFSLVLSFVILLLGLIAADENEHNLNNGNKGAGFAAMASVLEPGENKLMLEFVGMEREIAMLRRHT